MSKERVRWIVVLAAVVLINLLLKPLAVRWDLTADRRYTIHPQSLNEVATLEEPATVTLFLNGEMNSSFKRLKESTEYLVEELHRHNRLSERLRTYRGTRARQRRQNRTDHPLAIRPTDL